MAKKLRAPIFLGVFTVLAILLLTGGGGGWLDDDDDDKNAVYRQTFDVNAVYYDTGHIEVSFSDKSEQTESVVMEVLGMKESFQKSFSGHEFIEIVPFPILPKYGWKVHPVVLEVEHPELGHVQIKTEVRPHGQLPPHPPVIFSAP